MHYIMSVHHSPSMSQYSRKVFSTSCFQAVSPQIIFKSLPKGCSSTLRPSLTLVGLGPGEGRMRVKPLPWSTVWDESDNIYLMISDLMILSDISWTSMLSGNIWWLRWLIQFFPLATCRFQPNQQLLAIPAVHWLLVDNAPSPARTLVSTLGALNVLT